MLVAAAGIYLQEFVRGFQQPDSGPRGVPWLWVVGVIAAITVVGALAGLVSWLTTRFVADDHEFRVETGWLFKQSRRVAYTRIQSVDVVQKLAARLLGLAEVRIDAGAGDHIALQYLSRKRSYELRDYLMARAHGQQTTVTASNAAVSSDAFSDLGQHDEILVRVEPGHLIIGALVSHELLSIILAFSLPLIILTVVSWINPGLELSRAQPYVAIGSLLPLIPAVLSYIGKRVIGQFNYTLARTRAGLRITRGLTNLTSQSVPVARIQSIRISQPLFWRWLRRYRVDLEVLGYGHRTTNEDTANTSTILLPIGTQAMVDTALNAVWPGLRLDLITFVRSPARARWLDPLAYGWNSFGVDRTVIVTRRGWLMRVQSIVPHARLQSTNATQGPIERLLRLANVWFHTTGLLRGHAAIHIDHDVARRLVYDEADRATTARADELVGNPPPSPPPDPPTVTADRGWSPPTGP